MIWVLRPGKEGMYYTQFISEQKLFLPWSGYNVDLRSLKTRDDFRNIVIQEKHPEARTTVSNWSAQLYSFCFEMSENDIVLVPSRRSKDFAVTKLIGDYYYEKDGFFHHFRDYDLITEGIPRSCFTQSTQYSLGAYRTLFKVKQESEIMQVLMRFTKVEKES